VVRDDIIARQTTQQRQHLQGSSTGTASKHQYHDTVAAGRKGMWRI
jgi:hypothetical protein